MNADIRRCQIIMRVNDDEVPGPDIELEYTKRELKRRSLRRKQELRGSNH